MSRSGKRTRQPAAHQSSIETSIHTRLDGTTCSTGEPDIQRLDSATSSEGEDSETESGVTDDLGIFGTISGPGITDKTKSKIWAGEYIDLSKLYFGTSDTDVEVTVTKSHHETTKSVKRPASKTIYNILTWSRAFQRYASIYTLRFPQESSQMFQYMSLIQSLATKFPNWYQYDMKFRTLRSKQPLPWGSLHTETYLYVNLMATPKQVRPAISGNITNPPRHNTAFAGRAKPQNKQLFREGFCWTFQKSGKCEKPGCPHKHKCALCTGSHPGSSCKKTGNTASAAPSIGAQPDTNHLGGQSFK